MTAAIGEPTVATWTDGELFVRVDANREQFTFGVRPDTILTLEAPELHALLDLLGNAGRWLDRYIAIQVAEEERYD